MKKLNSQKGFSLVELLVVIAIIAVLISIAAYGLMIAQRNSRNSQRNRVANELKVAIESYYRENGRYPANNLIQFNSTQQAWIVCLNQDCTRNKTIEARENHLRPHSLFGPGKAVSTSQTTIYCYKVMEQGSNEQGRYKLGYGAEEAQTFVNIGTTVNERCNYPPASDETIPGSGGPTPPGGQITMPPPNFNEENTSR